MGGRPAAAAPAADLVGPGVERLNGLLDKQEDRVDVYRIVIPAGRSATASVIPRFGDPSLEVFSSAAFSVNDLDNRIASSRLRGKRRTEKATIVNPDAESHSYYVTVRPQGSSRYQEREYTVRVG